MHWLVANNVCMMVTGVSWRLDRGREEGNQTHHITDYQLVNSKYQYTALSYSRLPNKYLCVYVRQP